MQVIHEKHVMTVPEVATMLGVSLPIAYEITERADFTALVRIGRRKLILRHKFLEWLEDQAINKCKLTMH